MGACRESTAFWVNPRGFRRELREMALHPLRRFLRHRRWPLERGTWREFWGDNLGPLVCRLLGHRAYVSSTDHEPTELACRRCHRFLWRAPETPDPAARRFS